MLMRYLTHSSSSILSQRHRASPRLQLETLEERCVLNGDTVLEWNTIALDAMVNDSYLGADAKQKGPGPTARALAIVQAAVYDAVNSIDRSFDPYLISVKATGDASIDAAAAQAAHDTLAFLFPDYIATLDLRLAEDLAEIPSPSAREAGVHVGQTVAAAILAARADDGSDVTMTYTPSTKPGKWRPDPLHPNQIAVGPQWGEVTPFVLRSSEQFHIPRPPRLTSREYAEAFNEVKNLGGDGVTTQTIRTDEQTIIGIFWGYDGTPGLSTPPRLYNQIAATLAVQEGNTEVENARYFAMVNLAMADAAITCWGAKYDYEFWRPVTAIREANTDGNSKTTFDPNWSPLGAPNNNGGGTNFTPPFPAYASGHATFGAASMHAMARFFGTDNISFTLGSDEYNGMTVDQNGEVRPLIFRSYTSFSQAIEENGQSRIYLGIHWKFDKEQGIRQGNRIADYVFENYLRPVNQRHHDRLHHLEQFRAVIVPSSGAVALATTDGKPFNPLLGSRPRTATITTQALDTHDTVELVTRLMTRLDRGVWGGAHRHGKVLVVDMTIADGDLFNVFHGHH